MQNNLKLSKVRMICTIEDRIYILSKRVGSLKVKYIVIHAPTKISSVYNISLERTSGMTNLDLYINYIKVRNMISYLFRYTKKDVLRDKGISCVYEIINNIIKSIGK